MTIREDTRIEELVKVGIVPEWMWRYIRPHGMDEAWHILNEWDWEWGWDIGDGYDQQEREELERVRKIINDGIETFESDPVAVQQYKEEKEQKCRLAKQIKEFKEKYSSNCDWYKIPWLVEYYNKGIFHTSTFWRRSSSGGRTN